MTRKMYTRHTLNNSFLLSSSSLPFNLQLTHLLKTRSQLLALCCRVFAPSLFRPQTQTVYNSTQHTNNLHENTKFTRVFVRVGVWRAFSSLCVCFLLLLLLLLRRLLVSPALYCATCLALDVRWLTVSGQRFSRTLCGTVRDIESFSVAPSQARSGESFGSAALQFNNLTGTVWT